MAVATGHLPQHSVVAQGATVSSTVMRYRGQHVHRHELAGACWCVHTAASGLQGWLDNTKRLGITPHDLPRKADGQMSQRPPHQLSSELCSPRSRLEWAPLPFSGYAVVPRTHGWRYVALSRCWQRLWTGPAQRIEGNCKRGSHIALQCVYHNGVAPLQMTAVNPASEGRGRGHVFLRPHRPLGSVQPPMKAATREMHTTASAQAATGCQPGGRPRNHKVAPYGCPMHDWLHRPLSCGLGAKQGLDTVPAARYKHHCYNSSTCNTSTHLFLMLSVMIACTCQQEGFACLKWQIGNQSM